MRWNDVFASQNLFTYEHNPYSDNLFWDAFRTPTPEEGKMPFDRAEFFGYLKRQVGEFTACCEDPFIAVQEVQDWSGTRLYHWQRIYNTLAAEYEPLWNYNRYEEVEEHHNRNEDENTTETDKASSDTNDHAMGYDGRKMVDTASEDASSERDNVTDHVLQERQRRQSDTHAYGNIGVMSTQDLIKQEIEIAEISLYNIIIDEFKAEFCVLIY